jgi:glucosylceramidase
MMSCKSTSKPFNLEVYETSASGNKLKRVNNFEDSDSIVKITLKPDRTFQTLTGFGGSFTDASGSLLNKLGKDNRKKIIEAYFSNDGARYSLTRTHINSCDFSLNNYDYETKAGDTLLSSFSIQRDKDGIIPFILESQKVSKDGFKIIASPWTAPPWMKDNNSWKGGKLLTRYYDTWALYFSKYLSTYKSLGIDIWGVTVENEPLGNDSNWESMHYTPQEMNTFVKKSLGPTLHKNNAGVKILGFDQNRDEALLEWAQVMYNDTEAKKYFDGIAVHWYASTYDYFPKALDFVNNLAPEKYLINTESCIDSEVPKWKDDAWYWSKEATDWGWDWAPEKLKHLHPKYVPVFRYAGDIIGCLNHGVDGWIDWNMVLDKNGGPNWAKNWCTAPVIVDPEKDEVYFTPLYYTISHFSKFIRPGAKRIAFEISDSEIMSTSVKNPDGSFVVILFNPTENKNGVQIILNDNSYKVSISPRSIQTVHLNQN